VVTTGPNGYKAIDYAKLVPLLIESIKAQQTRLEAQQKQIDKQEAEINDLKKIIKKQWKLDKPYP
jgi:hypothetical protein